MNKPAVITHHRILARTILELIKYSDGMELMELIKMKHLLSDLYRNEITHIFYMNNGDPYYKNIKKRIGVRNVQNEIKIKKNVSSNETDGSC